MRADGFIVCNSCGDKWTSGILGPLVAPASTSKDEKGKDTDAAPEKLNDTLDPNPIQVDGAMEPGTENVPTATKSTTLADPAQSSPLAPTDHQPEEPNRSSDTLDNRGNVPKSEELGMGPNTSVVPISGKGREDIMDVDPPHSLQIDGEQTGVAVPALPHNIKSAAGGSDGLKTSELPHGASNATEDLPLQPPSAIDVDDPGED